MAASPDVWLLIFQQLVGDYESLRSISLVCRAWRTLSWPCLLQVVDISSHNIEGRLTEHEGTILPLIYSHHHAKYRAKNLVPRQRCFLRLIVAQPHLAKYIQCFTWTLVWIDTWHDYEPSVLLDIDRETWNVFAMLLNVTHLDLASLHDVWDVDLVHKNPPRLFRKVTDLRLLGWMHRDLVKVIVGAIDVTKLRRLSLDYLEDQGNLPDGHLMSANLAQQYAPTARRARISDLELFIDDELFRRQERGAAAIFPGPMWYPMRLLSAGPLDSLSYLQVTRPHFVMDVDVRNYYTAFRETARLLRKASGSLRSRVIVFGESTSHYYVADNACETSRMRHRFEYRPWCIKMATTFLKQILIALEECSFPDLTQLTFEGFHLIEANEAAPGRENILEHLRRTPFGNIDLTGVSHVDGRSFSPVSNAVYLKKSTKKFCERAEYRRRLTELYRTGQRRLDTSFYGVPRLRLAFSPRPAKCQPRSRYARYYKPSKAHTKRSNLGSA
jgi:hypothetical protein